MVEEAYESCRRILRDKRDALESIARGLLEYETLTADEVKALLRGEKITREEPGVHVSARSTVPITDSVCDEKTEKSDAAEKTDDSSATE